MLLFSTVMAMGMNLSEAQIVIHLVSINSSLLRRSAANMFRMCLGQGSSNNRLMGAPGDMDRRPKSLCTIWWHLAQPTSA